MKINERKKSRKENRSSISGRVELNNPSNEGKMSADFILLSTTSFVSCFRFAVPRTRQSNTTATAARFNSNTTNTAAPSTVTMETVAKLCDT